MTNILWPILATCAGTFFINIPCGYFRAKCTKFSLKWFFFIHLPVPFVIMLRKFMGTELTWTLAPILLGSYFLGQNVGIRWQKSAKSRKSSGSQKAG